MQMRRVQKAKKQGRSVCAHLSYRGSWFQESRRLCLAPLALENPERDKGTFLLSIWPPTELIRSGLPLPVFSANWPEVTWRPLLLVFASRDLCTATGGGIWTPGSSFSTPIPNPPPGTEDSAFAALSTPRGANGIPGWLCRAALRFFPIEGGFAT